MVAHTSSLLLEQSRGMLCPYVYGMIFGFDRHLFSRCLLRSIKHRHNHPLFLINVEVGSFQPLDIVTQLLEARTCHDNTSMTPVMFYGLSLPFVFYLSYI